MPDPLNIVIKGEDKTSQAFAAVGTSLKGLSGTVDDTLTSFDGLAEGSTDAASSAGAAGGKFDVLGSVLAGVATGGVAILVGALATIGTTLVGITTAGLKWATEFASGMKMVEAQTGIAGDELDSFRSTAQDVFQAGLGESFADVAGAMTQVHQITGATGEAMQAMTAQAMTLAEVFDVDVGESVRAVDQAMIAFGEQGTAVFDMMTATMQATGDPMDDLADTINEYSTNFAEAGFSAEQMFGVLNAGLEAGAWNFDKVGDAVREFFIRLEDGSDTTRDALNKLFTEPGSAIATITQDIEDLTWVIETQESALEDTKAALDDANTAWGAAQKVVQELENALSEARAELNELARPNLAGMEEFDDRIFSLEQNIKQARLAMLDMQEDTPEFDSAKGQLEGLNKELEKTRLARDIQYDAQFRALEEAVAAGTEEVITFDQAMAEIVAKKGEIDGLEASLWGAQAAEAEAATNAERLQAAYDTLSTNLNTNKQYLEGLKGLLEEADTPANKLLDDLASGSITGADAMSQVVQALKEIEDPIQRNQVGVGLFGSMWEDMGESVILALDPATAALGDFEGATGRAQEATERGLGPAFDRLKRTLKVSVGEGFAPVLTMLVENITPAFESFAEWLKGDGSAVFERFGTLLTDNLAPALEQLGPFIEDKVIPALEKFGEWLVNEGIPAIQDLIDWLINEGIPALKTFGGFIVKNVIPAMMKIAGTVDTIVDAFKSVFKLIGKVLGQIEDIIEKSFKFIHKLVIKFWGNSLIVDAIIDGLKKILKFFEDIWDAIKKLIEKVTGEIYDIIRKWLNQVQDIIERVWNDIKSFIDKVMNDIQRIIEQVWSAIKSFIDRVMNEIETIIERAWNAIKSFIDTVMDQIEDIIEKAWNSIKSFIDNVMGQIKSIIESAWNAIKSTIDTVMNQIKSIIETAWNAIKSTIDTVLNQIKSIVENAWNSIKSTIDNVLNQIRSAVESAWNSIKDTISNKLREIGDEISSRWNQFLTNISNVLNNIITEVRNKFQQVYDAVREKLLALAEIPNQIASTLIGIGTAIIEKILQGVQNFTGFVAGVVDKIKSWLVDVFNSIRSSLPGAIAIGELIVERIVDGIRSFTTFVADLIDRLSTWLRLAGDQITSSFGNALRIGEKIVDAIIQGIRNARDRFINWLIGILPDWVRDAIDRAFSPAPGAEHIADAILEGTVRGLGRNRAALAAALRDYVSGASAGLSLPVTMGGGLSLPGGNLALAGADINNTTNLGGQTFNTTISDRISEEEFIYRVQQALRQLT